MSVVTVDRYGRIRLPKKVLEKVSSDKFIVFVREGEIILKPVRSRNFKELFDTVEVDLPSEAFRDYSVLKKYLLKREAA